jgi:arsenite-transporting ATPase
VKNGKGATVIAFAGKGGVGKTTCAAATALHLSRQGMRTLVISTDATPSLAHIFELSPAADSTPVAEKLFFQEIGLEQAQQLWQDKFGQDVYRVFSSFVDIGYGEFTGFMASVLPGLAEEFTVDYIRLLVEDGRYDRIVWDTAPLGQTLALLKTPALLSAHLRMAPRIYGRIQTGRGSRESILDIIKRWESLSSADMAFLQHSVEFNIVAIPEALSVNQLESTLGEIEKAGLSWLRLIINNVIRDAGSPFLKARAAQQAKYLGIIHERFHSTRVSELPLLRGEVKGLEQLGLIAEALY